MEVYVDDMLVKSEESGDHIHDLREAFTTLKKYEMKLNPTKCAFGVSSRKFWVIWSRAEELRPTPKRFEQ
jgi:hypothetical protein